MNRGDLPAGNEARGAEPDLSVRLGPLTLAHPVLNASGTYDVLEAAARYEGDALHACPFAAYVPKTVTMERRAGNPPPRVGETPAGMINAIGLENKGLDAFLVEQLPALAPLTVPLIVNVGGRQGSDYVAVVARLEEHLAAGGSAPEVAGYELNVSCPNVRTGLSIGTDPAETERLTRAVRAVTERLLIVKLTPNVSDVAAIARAAVGGGADAVSLVNTFKALILDRQTLRPFLGNRTGGLCGPAIKPIALRMVSEVAQAVAVPIIGMGGVVSGLDVLEFVACGATAVAVGMANFVGIEEPARIVADVGREMAARGFTGLEQVRGLALA